MNISYALGVHRFIARAALSGAGIFAWIFAFQFYLTTAHGVPAAIIRTAFLYLLVQTVTALLTPFTARLVRNGVRRAMIFGITAAAVAFVLLGAAFSGYFGSYLMYGIAGFALSLGLYRALYWIPYAVEKKGEHVFDQFTQLLLDILLASMPLAVGIYLVASPLSVVSLLFICAFLLLFSLLPLASVSEKYERFDWGYAETFSHLAEPRFNKIVLSSLFDGAQGAALFFLWPIFVFLIVGYSYSVLGAVISLALLLAIPARMFARSYARIWRFEHSPLLPAFITGTAWVIRLAVATPLGVILVDSYSTLSFPRSGVTSALLLEHAADEGSYIDEFTALKELGLALGRILMVSLFCALSLTLSLTQALATSFLLIACLAMFSIWYSSKQEVILS